MSSGKILSSRFLKIFNVVALVTSATIWYSNCSAPHAASGVNTSPSLSPSAQQFWSCADNLDELSLFTKTYQPFLTNNCSACHSGGGPGPDAFASSGVQLADTSFQAVGFTLIDSKALDGHSPTSGQKNKAATDLLMAQYVSGLQTIEACKSSNAPPELTQNQDGPTRIHTLSHPINPDPTKKVTVSWNLQADMIPNTAAPFLASDFQGVTLSATVEIFQRPGIYAYVISNPTLHTTNTDIQINSLLFKVNGTASPAQRAFYFVNNGIRAWNSFNPNFSKTNTASINYQASNDLISGGALVAIGAVHTTDVLSVTIGGISKVTLPPVDQGPKVSFGVATLSASNQYQIINIPIQLSAPATNVSSAELVFGPATTIKDQCCRSTLNDVGTPISVSHFDRDIQDFDTDPSLPLNNRLNYQNVNNLPGRYLVSFQIGEMSKNLQIKIVANQRNQEAQPVLDLQIDPSRLTNISAASTLQNFRLTILNSNSPYTGAAPTYGGLLSDGGILANECLRCHNSVLNRGGYDITNYEQMVSKSVLIPGNPIGSIMFLRMNSANIPGLTPMPLTGLIPASQRQDVSDWISAGAANN